MKPNNNDRFKQFEYYVNIKVPRELRDKIKTTAAKKGISIIEYLKSLTK